MSELFLGAVNTAIMAGWLVIAVLLVRLLLKKAPAWTKCALWAIVALRLVWPFKIESILSLIPSAQTLPPSQLYNYVPELDTGFSSVNAVVNPIFAETFASEPANSVNPLQVVTEVAAWVWLAGMAVMALYAIISYVRLRRMVRLTAPLEKDVYLSDGVNTPFILGIIRPKIYLPSDLEADAWGCILSHERAHIARKDHWWKPLGFILLTVFWFHPLLWLAYWLLCRDVEMACDEKVIQTLTAEEKKTYSEVLLSCSVPKKWISACPLAFGETGVKQRIKAVLHYKKPALWILIAALIIGSVLAVCFLTEPYEQPEEYDALYIERCLFSDPSISFFPHLTGRFRVTDDGILQYDYVYEYMNVEDGWHTVGRLEKFTLTKENFDDHFVSFSSTVDIHTTVKEMRKNNKNAWRVLTDGDCLKWGGYFLEQENGDFYYFYGTDHLFKLTKEETTLVAGKTYQYAYGGEADVLRISIREFGVFTYYENLLSEYEGGGYWYLEGDVLYLHDAIPQNPKTYVFRVEGDALIYVASESDTFDEAALKDGAILTKAAATQQYMMFVDVVDIHADYFIGVDAKGTHWKINTGSIRSEIDDSECWVVYYRKPTVLEEEAAQYAVDAVRCWLYKEEDPKIGDRVYDTISYDIDGDGVLEECVLSENRSEKTVSCRLTIWDGDVCEYETCFNELLVLNEETMGYIPSVDVAVPPIKAYANVYAFAFSDGELMIVTPSGSDYIYTGQLRTFQVRITDGELTVKIPY